MFVNFATCQNLSVTSHWHLSAFAVFAGCVQSNEKSESLKRMSPVEVVLHNSDFFSFSSHIEIRCGHFVVYLVPCFSHFCALCWWLCCLKYTQSTVLKYCLVLLSTLVEKICELAKLWSGMTYSAVGCKFDVNKSTINVFKQKQT